MKSRGSILASLLYFFQSTSNCISTKIPSILIPITCFPSLHSLPTLYGRMPHRWSQSENRPVEKNMFSLWIGTIVHPETSASTHLFPIKPCISPWIWLFPAKFSLLFYKKGCTVAVFFFFLSTPLFWFWIHSHPLLPDRFLSLKPFSLSFCLLRFHFPIRKICKWTLILI